MSIWNCHRRVSSLCNTSSIYHTKKKRKKKKIFLCYKMYWLRKRTFIMHYVLFSSSLLKSLGPGNCSPIVLLQGLRQQWIDLILSFIRQLPNLQSHEKVKWILALQRGISCRRFQQSFVNIGFNLSSPLFLVYSVNFSNIFSLILMFSVWTE